MGACAAFNAAFYANEARSITSFSMPIKSNRRVSTGPDPAAKNGAASPKTSMIPLELGTVEQNPEQISKLPAPSLAPLALEPLGKNLQLLGRRRSVQGR